MATVLKKRYSIFYTKFCIKRSEQISSHDTLSFVPTHQNSGAIQKLSTQPNSRQSLCLKPLPSHNSPHSPDIANVVDSETVIKGITKPLYSSFETAYNFYCSFNELSYTLHVAPCMSTSRWEQQTGHVRCSIPQRRYPHIFSVGRNISSLLRLGLIATL